MGNGACLQISHLGSSTICTKEKPLHLNNILCVPGITKKLLSISQLTKDNNVIVKFTSSSYFVKDPLNHRILLQCTLHDGLYQLHVPSYPHQVLHTTHVPASLWHNRLVHCSLAVVSTILAQNNIIVTSSKVSLCSNCCKAKAHKLPFNPSFSVATTPL
jgi:GAG-pre-integrase domain